MRKKLFKRLAIGFGALLALPIVVLLGALIALQFAPVRGLARDQLLGLLQGAVQGTIEVDDLRWPSLGHIELSGVRIKDRHGTLVTEVGALSAHVKLAPLLSGSVRLSEVTADGLYVDLGTPGTDRGLLSVFQSDAPAKPEPEDTGSALPVRIERLCVEGREIRIQPTPEESVALRKYTGCAYFDMAEAIEVRLDRLRGELVHNQATALAIVDEPALQLPAAANDVALGWLRGKLQIAGERMGFDGRVELRHVTRATLAAMKVDAEWLRGAADLSLAVNGDATNMRYQLELRAPGSKLGVRGEFRPEREFTAEIASDGLELARFTTLSVERLVFALGVRADLSRKQGPRVVAELNRGSYGAWALPKTDAQAEFGSDGSITLSGFEARYPAASVLAKGRVGGDGAISAEAQIKVSDLAQVPPVRAALPTWAGELTANARLRRAAKGGGSGAFDLQADVTLARLSAQSPAVAADRIELRVAASGSEQHPELKMTLAGRELHVGDQRFAQLELTAHNAGEVYQLQGNLDGDRGKLDGWIKLKDDGVEAGGQVDAQLPRGTLQARLTRLRMISGHSLEIDKLEVQHLGANLKLEGSIGLGTQPSQLRLQASSSDLSAIGHELTQSDLPGQLRLVASMEGELERPKVKLKAEFRDGPRFAGAPTALSLDATLDGPRGEAKLRARASAGPAVVRAALDSRWPRAAPLSAAMSSAKHELDVQLERASIAELVRATETELGMPLAGSVTAQVLASGTLQQLELQAEVDAQVKIGEEPNRGVKVRADYGGGGLALSAKVTDPHGDLLNADWHQQTRVETFLQKPPKMPEWLGQTPWEASVEVASRRLSELPTVRTQGTARALWPLRSELSINLAHSAGAEPVGEVHANASWDPFGVDPARATCSQRVKPTAKLTGKLREGLFVAEFSGRSADADAFSVSAQLGSTLEEWLEGSLLQITRARIAGQVKKLDLAQWPVTCEQAAGTMTASFSANELFDKKAQFAAKLGGKSIVVGKSLPIDFDVQADAAADGLDVAMRIERIGGNATIRGSVPISLRVAEPPASINWDGPLALDVALSRVDVKSLLAIAPGVARPSGLLDGHIRVSGKLGAPRGTGAIDLKDVSLTLPELGQRFTKVNGRIAIDNNKVRIPELAVRDQNGVAKFSAELELQTVDAWKMDLKAKFDDFPVRKQGVLMGRADAAANVHMTTTKAQTDVEVRLRNVSVNLSGDTGAQVQSLDDHPEIVVAGEEPEVEEEESPSSPSRIINVYVRSDESLWVRRDDFAIRMQTDLTVHVAHGSSQITGEVKLERGFLDLLGKQFDVKTGRVVFTGGQAVNPRLELTAASKTPSGDEVRVEVTGYVSAPELAFFVDDDAQTAGEALAALTGLGSSRGGQDDPEGQIASMAMGMTTGLLSLGARREFGDFIPMFSVEQNTDETRVRAGVEADRLIPKFMRGFVRGAYVEGLVSSGDPNAKGEDSGGGAEGGVLLELMLPKDLVWAGQYGPGQTWSVDLDWRP